MAELPILPQPVTKTAVKHFGPEVRICGSLDGNMGDFVLFMQLQGVHVSYGGRRDAMQVAGSWDDAPAGDVVRTVGMMFEEPLDAIRRGDATYILGKPSDADMQARVFHVTGDDAADFQKAIQPLLSKYGTSSSVGDALIVKDLPDSMDKIDQLYDGLTAARGQFLVEVRFVELSREGARKLGIDWSATGQVVVPLLTQNAVGVAQTVLSGSLTGLLRADESDSDVRLLTPVRVHCIEGEDAEIQIGDTIPVPQKTVSESGTVSTTGYDQIDTGVLLHVGVRTEPDGRLRVHVQPELSSVSGYVEGYPIRSRRRVDTSAVVVPGGVVVVGGFSQQKASEGHTGLPFLSGLPGAGVADASASDSRLYIVVRVTDPMQAASDQTRGLPGEPGSGAGHEAPASGAGTLSAAKNGADAGSKTPSSAIGDNPESENNIKSSKKPLSLKIEANFSSDIELAQSNIIVIIGLKAGAGKRFSLGR